MDSDPGETSKGFQNLPMRTYITRRRPSLHGASQSNIREDTTAYGLALTVCGLHYETGGSTNDSSKSRTVYIAGGLCFGS